MNRWYVVQTHAMAEEKAAFNLKRQGFALYLPRYLKKRSHARRVDWVLKALFPRYLFINMDAQAVQWRAIKSTFGVCNFICQGEEPTPVPEGVVEGIMACEDENGCIGISTEARFKKGQVVEITDGPMAEVLAIFDCVDDKDRVTVLMDLLGRQVRVRTPLNTVRATA